MQDMHATAIYQVVGAAVTADSIPKYNLLVQSSSRSFILLFLQVICWNGEQDAVLMICPGEARAYYSTSCLHACIRHISRLYSFKVIGGKHISTLSAKYPPNTHRYDRLWLQAVYNMVAQ